MFFDIQSGVLAVLVAIEDPTSRKQTAEQLRCAEETYRHLIENAYDGILIGDQNGVIEFANHQIEEMFGYSAGELTGQNYETLISDQYLETLRDYQAGFIRKPKARDMGRGVDLYGKRKDGSTFPVEISLSRVTLESKFIVTAIVRDISERKYFRLSLLVRSG